MEQKPKLQQFWNKDSERVVTLFRSILKAYRDHISQKSREFGFTGPQVGLILSLYKNPFSTLHELVTL